EPLRQQAVFTQASSSESVMSRISKANAPRSDEINPLHWSPLEGWCEKLGGRASWRAIAAANPYPTRLGGSLALPISAGFEFFHTSQGVQGDVLWRTWHWKAEGHPRYAPLDTLDRGISEELS